MKTTEQLEQYRKERAHWASRAFETWVVEASANGPSGRVSVVHKFSSLAEARVAQAGLPKSLKARVFEVRGNDVRPLYAVVELYNTFGPSGRNGSQNESGVARALKALELLSSEWDSSCCSNSLTEQQFRELVKKPLTSSVPQAS